MAEYIVISVPDEKDIACFNCERDTCVEVGCKHAPSVFTARPKERIVRCKDCKYAASLYGSADYLDCMGPLTESWDYYNDQPKENPVPDNGFCSFGAQEEAADAMV